MEEVRLDDVIRVHDADDLDVRVEAARGLVERAGLEPGPAREVDEPELLSKPAAVLFHGAPQYRIGGVVDDHLDSELWVVEPGKGFERLPHEVGGFVVGGHL